MDNNIIYLSVPRKDNRINCTSDDLYNDLYEFWMNTDSIYRNFSGFIDDDINGIFTGIELVQSFYGKDYYLRYHELVFSISTDIVDESSAINLFEMIHQYIAANYQVLMTVGYNDNGTYIQARFFVNAVSHVNGAKLMDNRNYYKQLSSQLNELTGFKIKLDNGVLFGVGEDNYTHQYN